MTTIQELTNKYRGKIDYLDLEIIIANSLSKTREFILTYPEHKLTGRQLSIIEKLIARRAKREPIAYILGHKEFYGLDFVVNKHTLVPRPETEMVVENVLSLLRSMSRNTAVIDLGTGSGNIIVSIAHSIDHGTWNMEQKKDITFFGSDISSKALAIAKKNSKKHNLDKKIKFLHGSLLEPIIKELKCSMLHDPCSMIITANLPYLSKDIYDSAPTDVKKFEPKSALYSPEAGLQHYRKLLEQLKKLLVTNSPSSTTLFLEISPEQKTPLPKIIKAIFPSAKIEFQKDLARKWRVCKITI